MGSISANSLNEIKNMANPPAAVKMALDAVVSMLQNIPHEVPWDAVRKAMKDSHFIKTVQNFNADKVNSKTLDKLDKVMGAATWDLDKINRASKAAGPLASWAEAQLKFSRINKQIEPLKKELREMQEEAGGDGLWTKLHFFHFCGQSESLPWFPELNQSSSGSV